jgi:hypothetical protein
VFVVLLILELVSVINIFKNSSKPSPDCASARVGFSTRAAATAPVANGGLDVAARGTRSVLRPQTNAAAAQPDRAAPRLSADPIRRKLEQAPVSLLASEGDPVCVRCWRAEQRNDAVSTA